MIGWIVLTCFLLISLFWLSLLESALSRLTRVSVRVMLERDGISQNGLLMALARDRARFLVPLQFAIEALTVAIAILMAKLFLDWQIGYSVPSAIIFTVLVMGLVRELIPKWMTQQDPERFVQRLLPLWSRTYQVISLFAAPILWVLKLRQARSSERSAKNGKGGDEASDEEIQAYLGVGEEEGIFEQHESELIQSALEFRSTLVREIMTPRSQIVSIAESATVGELAELIASSKHSRIPVYRETPDSIVGVVYVRNLVSHLSRGKDSDPVTALMKEVWFVPETKKVTDLLKEMQRQSEPLAIVVSEYGAISGLVTIEDLVEEIVGEIYDEDELRDIALIDEGQGIYRAHGRVELSHLQEVLRLDLGETDATTLSGLVVDHLGYVPSSGEKVELDGLLIKVLDSDRKRIKMMRVWSPGRHSPEQAAG